MKKKPVQEEPKPLNFNFDTPEAPKAASTPSYAWGRQTDTPRRANVLTADEVMGAKTEPMPETSKEPSAPTAEKPKRPTEPIAMKPSEPVANASTEPTEIKSNPATDNMSFAARMVLQRMQERETAAAAAEAAAEAEAIAESAKIRLAKPQVPAEPIPMHPAEETPVKMGFAQMFREDAIEESTVKTGFAQMFRDEPSVAEVPPAAPVVAPPVVPADPALDGATHILGTTPKFETGVIDDIDTFADARRRYVEDFTLESDPEIAAEETASGETKVLPVAQTSDFDFLKQEPQPEPETDAPVESIEDYRTVDDADAVYTDFTQRKARLTTRSLLTTVLAALLLLLTFVKDLVPFDRPAFFISVGVMLVLGALCNLSLFSSLTSLFKGRNDADFAPMLALLASMLQTGVAGWIGSDGLTATSMLAGVAMLSIAVNDFAKLAIVKRVLLNFEVVGNEEPKTAVSFVGAPESAKIADPSRVGQSLIVGRTQAIDLSGFLSLSLSPDPYESISWRMNLISLIAGAINVVLTAFLLKGNVAACVTAFAVVAAVCAPFTALMATGRSLLRLCRQLRHGGTMLSGYRAAEDITEANVVQINAAELFSDDCLQLFHFKVFDDFPYDQAFLRAAALTKEGNSTMAGLFEEIVRRNEGRVPSVDSVIYEDGMGLTGWVNDRKTMLGNRMILESHNIQPPPLSFDKKIVSGGKFPVYLAVDDRLVAMFIVGYKPDRSLLHRVRKLYNTGVSLLVDTSDPNVTASLVADCYGIPKDAVLVMSANSARRCQEQFAPRDREAARMTVSNVRGYIDGYLASYRLRQRASATCTVTILSMLIGLMLTIALPLFGMQNLVHAGTVLILHVVTYLLMMVLQSFYRI